MKFSNLNLLFFIIVISVVTFRGSTVAEFQSSSSSAKKLCSLNSKLCKNRPEIAREISISDENYEKTVFKHILRNEKYPINERNEAKNRSYGLNRKKEEKSHENLKGRHLKQLNSLITLPTSGQPWPLPQKMSAGSDNLTVTPGQFQFRTASTCDVVLEAIKRYSTIIFQNNATRPSQDIVGSLNFASLEIVVDGGVQCERYPYLNMNENYSLSVWPNGTGLLRAGAIWGVLRGLETFSQLFFTPDQKNWYIRTADIVDYPRFAHRGILLDTSRHYLTIGTILKNLDLMAQNKYNVFHWHIVDDHSFPYVSKLFPDLSAKGAYSPKHIYTFEDIGKIIEYARLRGIRVVPEFDTPGHTTSWGFGQDKLLTECYDSKGKLDGTYGPIDPSHSLNYDFLLAFFREAFTVFPDRFVHLGGDEVSFDCWASNPNIRNFMQLQGYGTDYAKLEEYYIQNLLWIILRARNDTGYLVWQEVVDNGVKVKPDTVVHVWKGNNAEERAAELAMVTGKKLTALLSSCWYLNYINYGIDWHDHYACDPQAFNGTQAQKNLVIGGEACMWGEYVDDTNVIPRLWPRASVVAERLWSSVSVSDPTAAAPRLEEHRCRLLRRGFQVESMNGPGFCPLEWID